MQRNENIPFKLCVCVIHIFPFAHHQWAIAKIYLQNAYELRKFVEQMRTKKSFWSGMFPSTSTHCFGLLEWNMLCELKRKVSKIGDFVFKFPHFQWEWTPLYIGEMWLFKGFVALPKKTKGKIQCLRFPIEMFVYSSLNQVNAMHTEIIRSFVSWRLGAYMSVSYEF